MVVFGVYMILCDCGLSYIGEICCNIIIRFKEYICSVKNMDIYILVVVEYVCSVGMIYFFCFDKVFVLVREKYFVLWKVCEVIEISCCFNFNRDGGWVLFFVWKLSL